MNNPNHKTKFKRLLDLNALISKKSILLLGPRGVGKSFALREQLKDNSYYINLLKNQDYLKLSQNPSEIEQMIDGQDKKIVVIDEIQKVAALMDEVHRLIEEKNIRFLLTGSSARKLNSKKVNLLAGRAWIAKMYPLVFSEIPNFDLEKSLMYGMLPSIYLSEYPLDELESYVQTYLEAEIQLEGLVRKIPDFHRFLKAAALSSGELLNYENISSDAQVSASTVREHYKILSDTLVGHILEPYKESKKRKAISTSKFYFFDCGVLNYLSKVWPSDRESSMFGNRFEHFIINEVIANVSYQRRKIDINFWRASGQVEVDLLFGDTAVEIKSSKKATDRMAKNLHYLKEERQHKNFIVVSTDETEKKSDGIHFMNYKLFLKRLTSGEI